MKSLLALFTKYKVLWLLMVFFMATRVIYLYEAFVPFSFDHGKDSLAILDMVVNLSPKFVGPWTSIPGLYFGPGWYYLLAPFYVLFGYHPVGAVWAMVLLVLVQMLLAYKYLGKYEALIITAAPLWIIFSKSAWNPYPMSLTSLIILIVLMAVKKRRVLSWQFALLLGLAAAFGFHFSAAYAIFYPVIIVLALLCFRVKISLKALLAGVIGLGLPFFPQFLFELKNNFIQTRAVIGYFQQGEAHTMDVEKVMIVLRTTYGEVMIGIMPETAYLGPLARVVATVIILGFLWVLIKNLKYPEIQTKTILVGLFVGLPLIGFLFLHFNVWYVYAMVPAAVMLLAALLRKAPPVLKYGYLLLLILSPVYAGYLYFSRDRAALEYSRGFLPVKLAAIELIKSKAGDRPYASYHYVPDIYDFSYQYIYFWQAYRGDRLPTEFAYKPGESSYVVQKIALLSNLPASIGNPEVIFYVVETPERSEYLDSWWSQQSYSEIEEIITLGPDVTVYVAKP